MKKKNQERPDRGNRAKEAFIFFCQSSFFKNPKNIEKSMKNKIIKQGAYKQPE